MRETYTLFFARFFIASMFLISAVLKLFTLDIQVNLYHGDNSNIIYIFIILSIIIEIIFSIMLIIGYKTKLAIIILIMFLIGNTMMIPHKFSGHFQYIIYKKNLAIFGGLIALFYLTIKLNQRDKNET